MGLTATFSEPYYTGTGTSTLVPDIFPVALNGRPFMIDTSPETFYVRWNIETLPYLRQQADQSNSPAEASLNPQGLWRRAQDSWHYGAGQIYRDRDTNSDQDQIRYRYRSSKGIDPWTRFQLGLLNDTTNKKSSANTNLYAVVAGARVYLANGNTVQYSTDMTSWSTVTGYTGGSVLSITSDGFNVYWTDGSDIWTTNTGTAAGTSADTKDGNLVRFVKGRLMVAVANILYNIPVLGSAASMTFTHPVSSFTWVDCCEGNSVIYAVGYAGDKSGIYRTAIKADGTALDIPVSAGSLPDGEIVRSIQGYLGFVWIGTDKGVRFCEADPSGNLTIGPLVQTNAAVMAFEPQDRFMWFGWTNYDSTSTGLGRMDLTTSVNTDQLAYASDLMATTQGIVSSIATFLGVRVFTVQGHGLYADSATLVASGTIDMGLSGFGIPDPKAGVAVDIRADVSAGSYQALVAADGGAFNAIGSVTTPYANGQSVFPMGGNQAERFELRLVLTQFSSAVGPTILRWTMKVLPASNDGPAEIYHIPLLIYPKVNQRGRDYSFDVGLELAEISSLRASRQVVQLQYFDETFSGIVSDYKSFPYELVDTGTEWDYTTTCLLDFQRIV